MHCRAPNQGIAMHYASNGWHFQAANDASVLRKHRTKILDTIFKKLKMSFAGVPPSFAHHTRPTIPMTKWVLPCERPFQTANFESSHENIACKLRSQ